MDRIELNADVGELPGDEGRALDREILSVVNAANVACGAHAGDDASIEATLRVCAELGVAAAAHPGYPDREGFGRRRGGLDADAIRATVAEQVARVAARAEALGIPLRRVKAHGALYNEASADRAIAEALLLGIADVLPGATLLALAGSPFVGWARAAGFAVLREGFADRGYRADGTLVPRTEPGALLHDPTEIAARAVRLAREGRLAAADGAEIALEVETLCVHGDAPGAAARARALRDALRSANVSVDSAAP